jgi:phosphonate transport system substrate-binding protein
MRLNGCRIYLTILALVLVLLLAACKAKPTPTPTPTPSPTPEISATPLDLETPEPTLTATPAPLGSPSNPMVIGYMVETPSSKAATSADKISQELASSTGYSFSSQSFSSYGDLLTAFDEGRLHIAFLPPGTYLAARDLDLVDALLVTNHFGRFAYGTQFLAQVSSGFTPYFNPLTNQNTTDVGSALAQFAGKRPCLTEEGSLSGYWLPLGLLASESVPIQAAVVTQSQTAVIRSLYAQQICDFGATFALSGDPRTASGILESFPDVLDKVVVICRSEAVIPSINVSVSVDIPNQIRQLLSDALISLVKTADGKTLLTDALVYNVEDLKAVNDDYYDPLRNYLQAAGADIQALVGK